MGFLQRFGARARQGGSGVFSLTCSARELGDRLGGVALKPTYIAGFVSPHLDLDAIARQLAGRFPGASISLCTTSGELCGSEQRLYCAADGAWDRLVLQFSCPAPSARSVPISPARPKTWVRYRSCSPSCASPVTSPPRPPTAPRTSPTP